MNFADPDVVRIMNPKRQELLKLADRCEREAPSYELDCRIEHFCDPERARQVGNARAYTASLDAAVSLVPEGWGWSYSHRPPHTGLHISIWDSAHPSAFPSAYSEKAKTFATGVCAASLRARAALVDGAMPERV